MNERLIEILKSNREAANMTQKQVAEAIGKSERIYQYYEEGRSHPKHETILLLAKVLNFNPKDIFEYEQIVPRETMAKEANATYQQQLLSKKNASPKRNTVPYYDAEAAAGMVLTEMSPIHAPAGTIDIGDLLHDSQAAIRIYGNSMLPNYPPGCVVGLAKSQGRFIEPGEVYIVETKDSRLLKRLFYKDDDPESDTITCYSDNTMKFENGARHGKLAYPPFNLHKKEIINLFMVTGVIKRNTNSVIINRNNH